MREQIMDLVSRHCETLRREAADIAVDMETTAHGRFAACDDLIAKVHKLKGGSGTIGFAEVSRAAQCMEDALRACQIRSPGPEQIQGLKRLHDALQDCVSRIEPTQSALYARFS